jgi:hypothetical protein
MLEEVLDHFEGLEKQAKNSDFNNHPGIQNSIQRHSIKPRTTTLKQMLLSHGLPL